MPTAHVCWASRDVLGLHRRTALPENAGVERPFFNSVIDRCGSWGGYSDKPQAPLIRRGLPSPFGVATNSIFWAIAKERSAYYRVSNIEDGPNTLLRNIGGCKEGGAR